MNTEKVGRKDVWMVPYENLNIVDGRNSRIDYGDIEGLAQSILENTIFEYKGEVIAAADVLGKKGVTVKVSGVKVPLQGHRDGEKYFVTDGHRRHRAIGLLNERGYHIPAPFICEPKGTTEADRVVQMLVTNDGKPFNPLELADAVKRLLDFGWTEKEIAPKIGKTPLYVSRLNLLNDAPAPFKKLIAKGVIAPTLAIQIAGNGEIDQFLEDHAKGKFTNGVAPSDDTHKKITNKDLKKKDSWKFFKKFTTNVEPEVLQTEKKDFYEFMVRVLNNQVSTKEFGEFFLQP